MLEALARPDTAGVRWTTVDQWHVTLRFFGELPSADPVYASLAAADLPSATAQVIGPPTRMGRAVLSLPVSGLDALAAAVIQATAVLGRPPEDRPYRGHLTLARAWRGSTTLWSRTDQLRSEAWEVRSLAIVSSHLRPTGARYETVAAVPLGEGKGSGQATV